MAMELTKVDVTAPDSDIETPPRSTNDTKPAGFFVYGNGNGNGNGSLKRAHCAILTNGSDEPLVSYKECMRNHAAGIGGHAIDGCCEFMQQPGIDLLCAACGCHRNFHRRDPDDPAPLHRRQAPAPVTVTPATRTFYSGNHFSLKKTAPVPGSSPAMVFPAIGSPATGKKRFRTKFSQEQKEKMYEFSEKLGWKLQKVEKGMIDGFCKEIGVEKEVLKVWMHNNKNTLGKRDINVNGGMINGDFVNSGDRQVANLAGNGNSGEGQNGNDIKPVSGGSGDGSFSSSG